MRSRSALLACLALALALPGAAGAQTTTLIIRETDSSSGLTDGYINIAECTQKDVDGKDFSDLFSFGWNFNGVTTSTITSTTVWVSDNSTCASTGTRSQVGTVTTSPLNGPLPATGSGYLPLVLMQQLDSGSTCASPTRTTLYFCALGSDTLGAVVAAAYGSVTIDASVPGTPTMNPTSSGDGALNLSWSSVANASSYRVFVGIPHPVTPDPVDGNPFTNHGVTISYDPLYQQEVTGKTDYRMGGLVNDTEYWAFVRGLSPGGNPGPYSSAKPGTPRLVFDFWRLYRYDGGVEEGGCGGSAGLLALAALAPFVARLRRRGP